MKHIDFFSLFNEQYLYFYNLKDVSVTRAAVIFLHFPKILSNYLRFSLWAPKLLFLNFPATQEIEHQENTLWGSHKWLATSCQPSLPPKEVGILVSLPGDTHHYYQLWNNIGTKQGQYIAEVIPNWLGSVPMCTHFHQVAPWCRH